MSALCRSAAAPIPFFARHLSGRSTRSPHSGLSSTLLRAAACLCVLASTLLLGLLAAPRVALGQTDTTPPTFLYANAGIGTTELTMYFSEELDDTSVPAASAFTVTVDGTGNSVTNVAIGLGEGGQGRVTLTLTSTMSAGATVTVSYTVPTSDPLKDPNGNQAAGFTNRSVIVEDLTPPSLSSATIVRATRALKLTYNEAMNTGHVPASAFTVTVDGTDVSVTNVAIAGPTVTLTLAAAVSAGSTVTVSYSSAAAHPYKLYDASGSNEAPSFDDKDVTVVADTTAPILSSATLEARTPTLKLTFDEPLNDTSVPAASAFTVEVDGTPVNLAASGPVAISGSTVTLTLASAVNAGQSVTVGYAVPGTNPLQDPEGNAVAAFPDEEVTIKDTTPPSLSSATVENGTPTLTLTYNEPLDANAGVRARYFNVGVNGVWAKASNAVVAGSTVTLTVAAAVSWGSGVLVSYVAALQGSLRDPAGNQANDFFNQSVTIVDTKGPSLSAASVSAATLTLTYNERLDTTSVPAASAFMVKVDGTAVSLAASGPVAISGSTVTLTLASAVSAGSTVTVSYVVPSTNPIQDLGGLDAAALTDHAVTRDTTPPILSSATLEARTPTLTLTFDEALDGNSVPAASAFTVEVDGTTVSLAASGPVTISGSTVVLTLAAAVNAGQSVTVSYAVPGTNPLQDPDGSGAAAFADRTVTVEDTTPPSLSSATVENGTPTLTLTFDEPLDADAGVLATYFNVRVDGVWAKASNAVVAGSTVTLTAAATVSWGADPLVTYSAAFQGSLRDPAGNRASNFFNQKVTIVDTKGPSLSAARVSAVTLTLTYNERLDGNSVPGASAFMVKVDGTAVSLAASGPVAISGPTVTLTLAAAVSAGSTVTVSYVVPGTNPIQDLGGLDAAALTDHVVTQDTTAPSLSEAEVDGRTLTLTYDKALDPASVPAGSAFTVTVNGSSTRHGVSTLAVVGSTVKLTLAAVVHGRQTVTVSYTAPSTNAVQDLLGNRASGFGGESVTVVDTRRPVLTSATVDGTTLMLTYDEALDPNYVPNAPNLAYFSVSVDGNISTPSAVVVTGSTAGSTVELTLTTTVVSGGSTVAVTYVLVQDPRSIQYGLRDLEGNYAVPFSDQPVHVADTIAPSLSTAEVDEATLTLTYDERLDTNEIPATTAFDVTVDGGTAANPSSVAVTGSEVTLTLATAVISGQTVTMSYTAPISSPIRDVVGNAAAAFSDRAVTNVTLSSDAGLRGLVVTDGDDESLELSPDFSSDTTDYTVSVGNAVTTVGVTATVNHEAAILSGSLTKAGGPDERVRVRDGEEAELTDLAVGDNVLTVRVRAEDNTRRVYTLTVTRLDPSNDATLSALAVADGDGEALVLSPDFSSDTTDYTATVVNAVTSAGVTATVNHEAATLTGSLTKAGGTPEDVTLTSGEAAGLTELALGANVLTITVRAEDDTTLAYTLTVTRLAAGVLPPPPPPTTRPPPLSTGATPGALVGFAGEGLGYVRRRDDDER